jgi:hypothetical protein
MTVVLLGAVSGAVGRLIYATLARFLTNRTGARSLLFGVILVLLTLPDMSPGTPLSVSLLIALVLLYGADGLRLSPPVPRSPPEVHVHSRVHEPRVVAELQPRVARARQRMAQLRGARGA